MDRLLIVLCIIIFLIVCLLIFILSRKIKQNNIDRENNS